MMTSTHTDQCRTHAESNAAENGATPDQVAEWAAYYLTDGTVTCLCPTPEDRAAQARASADRMIAAEEALNARTPVGVADGGTVAHPATGGEVEPTSPHRHTYDAALGDWQCPTCGTHVDYCVDHPANRDDA